MLALGCASCLILSIGVATLGGSDTSAMLADDRWPFGHRAEGGRDLCRVVVAGVEGVHLVTGASKWSETISCKTCSTSCNYGEGCE